MQLLTVTIALQQIVVPSKQIAVLHRVLPPQQKVPIHSLATALGWGRTPMQATLTHTTGLVWGVEAIGPQYNLPIEDLYRIPQLLVHVVPPWIWGLALIDDRLYPALNLDMITASLPTGQN